MKNTPTTDPPRKLAQRELYQEMNIIQKHPAFVYFMFTYIISWGSAIAIVGLDGIPGTTDEQEYLEN